MTAPSTLSGSLRLLFLYDVAEEIRLGQLRQILQLPPRGREPSFRQPVPEYVRFEQPPVMEPLESVALGTGEQVEGRLKYYDYGVISVEYELAFACDWQQLLRFSSNWIAASEVERQAAEAVRRHLERARSAVIRPYTNHLSEDYCIIHLQNRFQQDGKQISGAELMENYGDQIAQLVRGECAELSREEKTEILQSRMSYYPADLAVIGWSAAVLYDSTEGAAPAIQLLEYANTQLLEFRHYDTLLTGVLADVYKSLEKGTGFLSRLRLARRAERLNTIRLEVRELTERVDNSIKFLSDMFSARLYHLAATKVGVPDYRRLVDDKLRTAGELYQFMMDRFYQGRAFVMELMIVIILIIDLIFLFRGKG